MGIDVLQNIVLLHSGGLITHSCVHQTEGVIAKDVLRFYFQQFL